MEAVADPLSNIRCNVHLCKVTKSPKEAIVNPIWVRLTRYADILDIVYVGTVNNSNNITINSMY